MGRVLGAKAAQAPEGDRRELLYNPGEVVNVPAAEIAIIVAQLAVYSLQNRSQLLSSPCYSGFSYGHCK